MIEAEKEDVSKYRIIPFVCQSCGAVLEITLYSINFTFASVLLIICVGCKESLVRQLTDGN